MCSQIRVLLSVMIAGGELAALGQSGSNPSEGTGQPVRDPFSFTIRARQSAVRLGEPIWVEVRMNNTSARPLRVHGFRGRGLPNYKVHVQDTRGNIVPRRPVPESTPVVESSYGTVIMPGRWQYGEIRLEEYYAIDNPGQYEIRLSRADIATTGIIVTSNTIVLTVTN